jgi:heme/copper-type cytochrome/quinol oxidase subunit 3
MPDGKTTHLQAFFALTRFHALHCSLGAFPLCLFLSLANYHMFSHVHVISFAFDHFVF